MASPPVQGTSEWNDWVAELFAPSFDITVKDVLEDKTDDAEIKSKIKRVSAFDPEAIKKVYERVHMMTVLDEEMRRQQVEGTATAVQGNQKLFSFVLCYKILQALKTLKYM